MAKFPQKQAPNMAGLLKQAQKMQDDMARIQNEISAMEFEGTAGGGAVKVVMTGDKMMKSFEIDPDLLNAEEAELLCDMLVAACNEAIRNQAVTAESKMAAVTSGMKLPGM